MRAARAASLAVVLAAALAGCAGATAPGKNIDGSDGALSAVKYVHDAGHKVGCWFYIGTDGHASIACIPDSQYQP